MVGSIATPSSDAEGMLVGPVAVANAGLKSYQELKESGVSWLGKVPAHWEVRRLKNWLIINELVLSEDTDPEYTFDYLDIGSVATGRLTEQPARIRFGAAPSRARRVVRSGDTIVSVAVYLESHRSGADSCIENAGRHHGRISQNRV